MTAWPKQTTAELNAFYGNPDADGNGVSDRAWEDKNLVAIAPPYRMALAWAPETPLKTIRVHRACAGSLQRALAAILAHYGSQQAVEAARMHLYGGCFAFRTMRGANKLSVHAYGAAIDLDPVRNPLGRPWRDGAGMMPVPVIEAFQKEGWTWGGSWQRPDAQHFQASTV